MSYRFEIRRDFVDGTYDVAKIEAASIDDAVTIARTEGDVETTMLLCIVDLEPIRPLVVFA